uniref:Uncharacterized protein n=1 Tax=Prolemur simus TaxID=1328070 RepID=A0A8C9AD35_PROSS
MINIHTLMPFGTPWAKMGIFFHSKLPFLCCDGCRPISPLSRVLPADPISTGPLSLARQHLCAWGTTAESILIGFLSPHWNFAQGQHLNCSKLFNSISFR